MFAKTFVLASLAALASAANYDVNVGGLDNGSPILKFNPEFVNALQGDTVTFHFQQKNHSVIQTSFGEVCHPNPKEGFNFQTPFHPVDTSVTSDFPTEVFTVNDATVPLWFYCSQATHCGKGMIFSINCPTSGTNSLDAFRASALAFGVQEAASASWAATATPDVYGGQTYAPVYAPTVTEVVTTGTAVWTTTYQSYENSPDATPAPEGQNIHTVEVGTDGGLTFNPTNITAQPRDVIQFVFKAKNHTVTQSTFGNPCSPLVNPAPGFDSGFMPFVAGVDAPTFELVVNDTAPIWVYCKQGAGTENSHCQKGMVFSVNADPTGSKNHTAFVDLAKSSGGVGSNNGGDNSNGGTSGTGAAVASTSIVGGVAGLALAGIGSIFALLL